MLFLLAWRCFEGKFYLLETDQSAITQQLAAM
ncbi:hypothetical protein PSYAC_03441 [Pseudomonas syringae pv. actinidiae str. M302091]|nr:hypothetical protein PSYAC_03441 [Pseudomonas syringae pv. actinidiae str. M302091]